MGYLFENLLIKGCVFSIYSEMGPEPLFLYPFPKDTSFNLPDISNHLSEEFKGQNYLQIAVKSISLLITDYCFENNQKETLEKVKIIGVLPFPDMQSIALTYFLYFYSDKKKRHIPATLSLLVHENKRSFIYDNINRLEKNIEKFSSVIIKLVKNNHLYSELEAQDHWEEMLPNFVDFFNKIQVIQEKPLSPITKKRRIKILFTGLEKTGKSSFLLMINRKFSKIPSLTSTAEPVQEPLNFLGTTIMKWDIPGAKKYRDKMLEKSEMYLFETDVLYYFIDIQNPRIKESTEFLQQIINKFSTYDTTIPIIFIFTKVDQDIAKTDNVRSKITEIKDTFKNLIGTIPHKFFETSIFSCYSILNAFSFGIRQLSPNKALIEYLLKDFMVRENILTSLLLNESGLVLASQEMPNVPNGMLLSQNQIFELTASNFTTIAQQFSDHFPKAANDTTKYFFSTEDLVLLKRFDVEDFVFYALLYTKNVDSADQINKNFPTFVEKIRSLLTLYIS
jgi:Ras-related GTP-binding protein A/B